MKISGWSLPSGIFSKALRTVSVTTNRNKNQIRKSRPTETPCGTLSLISTSPAASLLVHGGCFKKVGREKRVQKFFLFWSLAPRTADNAKSAEI